MESPPEIGFLEESPGHHSSMRLMSFGALGMSLVYGLLAVYMSSENALLLSLTTLVAAFAPKSAQKLIELKYKE